MAAVRSSLGCRCESAWLNGGASEFLSRRTECARVVTCKRGYIPRLSLSNLADRWMHLSRLTARVMRIVFDQTVNLPRRCPKFPQCKREIVGRRVDKFNVTSDRLADSICDLGVCDRRRSSNRIRLAEVTRLG